MVRFVSLIALTGSLCLAAPPASQCPAFIGAYQRLETRFDLSPKVRFFDWLNLMNEIRTGELAQKFCAVSWNRTLVENTMNGAAKALEQAGAVVKRVSISTPRWGMVESVCLTEGTTGPLGDFTKTTPLLQNAGFSPVVSLASKRGAHYLPVRMLFLDWFTLNWGRPSPIAYHERAHHFTTTSPLRGADHPLVGELKAITRRPISHEAGRVGAYTHQQLLDEPLAYLEATYRILGELDNHFEAGGNPSDAFSQGLYLLLKQSLPMGQLTAFQNMRIAEAVLADHHTELNLLGVDDQAHPEKPLIMFQLTVRPEQVVFPIYTTDPEVVDGILLAGVTAANLGRAELTQLYAMALQDFIKRRVILVRTISQKCDGILNTLNAKVATTPLTPALVRSLRNELLPLYLNLQRQALLPNDEIPKEPQGSAE